MSAKILVFLTVLSLANATVQSKLKLMTRIIHFNSPDSPYYNPNATMEEVALTSWEISHARIEFLKVSTGQLANFSSSTPDGTRIRVEAHPPLLMVLVYVGDPPVRQLLAMDTGSSLLWVRCVVGTLDDDVYDPTESSTFVGPVSCRTNLCDALNSRNGYCGIEDECLYRVRYLSDDIQGEIALETFSVLPPSNESPYTLGQLGFGCTTRSQELGGYDGVFALGDSLLSVPNQSFLHVFSYCVGNLNDPMDNSSFLSIGVEDTDRMEKALLMSEAGHYYVNLLGIKVANKKLDIDASKLRRHGYEGGALIDSGSSLTLLQDIAYSPFEAAIRSILEPNFPISYSFSSKTRKLCYEGQMQSKLIPDLQVAFQLENENGAGTDHLWIKFKNYQLFIQLTDYVFCLNVANSKNFFGGEQSLIGVNLQQNLYMVFDEDGETLSYQAVESCDRV